MSAARTAPDAPAQSASTRPVSLAQPVTLRRVTASEWIKFRTLRSTLAVLAAAIIGMLAIALIVAYNTRHLSSSLQPDDLVPSATLQGRYLAQLLIGALGVLFVTGEFSTGMIRSTFAAVPKRLPVLVAKTVVFTAVTALSMIAISLVAFLSGQVLIAHYRPGFSLSDPGVLRVVLGTGVYLTLVGLIGGAIGWIFRSTPGSLVAYFGVILVVPVLFGTVLGTWGKDVAQFLPSTAGASIASSIREPYTLGPWAGLGVLALWTAGLIWVAAVQLRRRDA